MYTLRFCSDKLSISILKDSNLYVNCNSIPQFDIVYIRHYNVVIRNLKGDFMMAQLFKKQEIYDLLDSKGISYQKMEHPAAFTMEQMEEYGVTKKGTVCKNLFLRDFKGKNHFLVTVIGDKKVDMRQLAEKIGSSKLSFGSAERLMKYIGVEQGSVSPLGILNDESKSVVMVFDRDLKDDLEVGVHPNDNTATLWLSFDDICRLIREHGSEIMLIDF